MSLPELIEIVPLAQPVRAEITVPGSKSITNRALILAALADGEVALTGALWSEDTQIMVECLQKLGFEIRVENDPDEFCNRTITVKGLGGKIPNSGTGFQPVSNSNSKKADRQDACPTTELFVGNAGTAARFLSAFVCLGNGVYRLSGVPRMHERPQAALFQALRELGYRVESEKGNDRLPVKIFNDGKRNFQFLKKVISSGKKSCRVSIEESSQFASALLLCAKAGGWKIEAVGENAEESPYVAMTSKLIEAFPKNGGKFQIEPDASSGSYFWAVDVLEPFYQGKTIEDIKPENKMNWPITIANWPNSTWQIDTKFPDSIAMFNGSNLYVTTLVASQRGPNWREQIYAEQFPILNPSHLERSNTPIPSGEFEANVNLITRSRKSDLGDSIMTLVVMASTCFAKIDFFDLGRLRLQETERVVALRTELTKCGAKVVEEGDTLTVYPSQLHGAEIETYNDHRMAMCFAILGLEVPGIKIINPACVKKTFPNFFQKLAAPPPHGLGATILDAKTGRKLSHEELFAD